MVYGYAEHCGIPWETVAKVFRRDHSHVRFKTVRNCYLAFREYLANDKLFTTTAQERNILFFSVSVMSQVYREVRDLTRSQISARLPDIIQRRTERIAGLSDELTFVPPTRRALRSEVMPFIELLLKETFKRLDYVVPVRLRSPLCNLIDAHLRSPWLSDYEAGVVVFGFGDDELLPSLYSHQFDCGCFGNLRSVKHVEVNFGEQSEIHIIPFADRDVMDVFMEGSNQSTRAFFTTLMQRSMREVADRIIKDNFSLTDDEFAVIKTMNEKTITDIMRKTVTTARTWIHEKSVEPVLNVVRALPKEDMATLAEALVEVTALKKKVSSDIETVGGPVDVCLVTKGDGLIWIKRKHYFDLDKNQQYLYNRFTARRHSDGDPNGEAS